MTISETLLPEYDQEMAGTRKLLERVPDNKLGWAPHEKSMSLGKLAGHIAEIAGWASHTMRTEHLKLDSTFMPYIASSRDELLKKFDSDRDEARAEIAKAGDEEFSKIWKLDWNGKTMMEMPRLAAIRKMVMNHLIHHRGQLSVYLRLLDIPVPGVYGASADERGA